ncbi:mobilization protein [Robertkochia marina]|uniref:Mobilization protein n=1 Tax=Robertkochia marina TaxID=1227945 RepID=A0A4S3LZX4_9FLAO|nr:MobB family relaxase [Robertkochia marina]THD67631.1 mobilization protein [Robertkochia marina]TRZ43364.1 mobilization protein [Robertkochia marina]
MYVTITPQKLGSTYHNSVADLVAYLEKENDTDPTSKYNFFFDQSRDIVSAEQVIQAIDHNTAKLRRNTPRFFSLVISPSKRELEHIKASPEHMQKYTRELMKIYANNFNRNIDGHPVTEKDLFYFAKIEFQRTFKEFDWQVKENATYIKQIAQLNNQITQLAESSSINKLQKQKDAIFEQIPHKLNGEPIIPGMHKPGDQIHVHVIVSRKDRSNRYSLSPGSSYKSSETILNHKKIARGFNRNEFYQHAETLFDKTFQYNRNPAESFQLRKDIIKSPVIVYKQLASLPPDERQLAFRILRESSTQILSPLLSTSQTKLAMQAFKRIQKALELSIKSSSIGY